MLTKSPLDRLSRTPTSEAVRGTRTVHDWWLWFGRWSERAPRRATLTVAVLAAVAASGAGPLAAGLAAGYTAYGVAVLRRNRRDRTAARLRDQARHEVDLLTCDVRAGVAPPAALTGLADRCAAQADPVTGLIADRLRALAAVIEGTGAPAVKLLERLAADLRSTAQAEATLVASTAGTRSSARMLAALPLIGPLLGYAIGADPLPILLDTPLGAGCLIGAAALQGAGLAWSDRLRRLVDPQGGVR